MNKENVNAIAEPPSPAEAAFMMVYLHSMRQHLDLFVTAHGLMSENGLGVQSAINATVHAETVLDDYSAFESALDDVVARGTFRCRPTEPGPGRQARLLREIMRASFYKAFVANVDTHQTLLGGWFSGDVTSDPDGAAATMMAQCGLAEIDDSDADSAADSAT